MSDQQSRLLITISFRGATIGQMVLSDPKDIPPEDFAAYLYRITAYGFDVKTTVVHDAKAVLGKMVDGLEAKARELGLPPSPVRGKVDLDMQKEEPS